MINKGDIFYGAWISVLSAANEHSAIEMEEWHVTKVDKNGIYLKQKTRISWGKLSKKHGDFGFLPNIPDYYKKLVPPNETMISQGLYKTKIGAYRSIKPILEKKVKELTRLLNRVNKSIKK